MPVIFGVQRVFVKIFFCRLLFNCAQQIIPGQFTSSKMKFAVGGASPLVLQRAPLSAFPG
jgi:hypothetical protein